jgi:hypothetical protein
MYTHRRYTFELAQPWPGKSRDRVMSIIASKCDELGWFRLPAVAEDHIKIEITVDARDQWWVHHRAMKLAEACFLAMRMGRQHIPEPQWEDAEGPVRAEAAPGP